MSSTIICCSVSSSRVLASNRSSSNGGLFLACVRLLKHLLQDDLFRRFFAAVPKIIEPVLIEVASHDLIEFWILIL